MNKKEKQELKDILVDIAVSAGYKIEKWEEYPSVARVCHMDKIIWLGTKTDHRHLAHELGHVIDRGNMRWVEFMEQYYKYEELNEVSAWVNGWELIRGYEKKEKYLDLAKKCLSTYTRSSQYHELLEEEIK